MEKKQRGRGLSPALIVSMLALVVGLSGTAVASHLNGNHLKPKSVGGGKLKPFTGGLIKQKTIHGSKLKPFTGGLLRAETVPGKKIVPDSLGGDQIDESKLGPVPAADRLSGSFSAKLAFGETAEVAKSGPFTLTAQCVQNGTTSDGTEGRDFVRLLIETTEAGSVLNSGVSSLTGNGPENFLGPDTAEADRVVDEVFVMNGNANYKTGGHFNAIAPSGAGVSAPQAATSAAINLFDTGCAVQGSVIGNS